MQFSWFILVRNVASRSRETFLAIFLFPMSYYQSNSWHCYDLKLIVLLCKIEIFLFNVSLSILHFACIFTFSVIYIYILTSIKNAPAKIERNLLLWHFMLWKLWFTFVKTPFTLTETIKFLFSNSRISKHGPGHNLLEYPVRPLYMVL